MLAFSVFDGAALCSDLLFRPDALITESEWRRAGGEGALPRSRGEAAAWLAEKRA